MNVNIMGTKYLVFQHKQTGEYFGLTLEENTSMTSVTSFGKTIEKMLEELDEEGVQITLYGTRNFSSYGANTRHWHCVLTKETGSVKLEVRTMKHADVLSTIREVYDEWFSQLYGDGTARALGMVQIEHKKEEVVEAPPQPPQPQPAQPAPPFVTSSLDDEIPF